MRQWLKFNWCNTDVGSRLLNRRNSKAEFWMRIKAKVWLQIIEIDITIPNMQVKSGLAANLLEVSPFVRGCPHKEWGLLGLIKYRCYLYSIVCQNSKKTLPMRIFCNSLIGICFIVCYTYTIIAAFFVWQGKQNGRKEYTVNSFSPRTSIGSLRHTRINSCEKIEETSAIWQKTPHFTREELVWS